MMNYTVTPPSVPVPVAWVPADICMFHVPFQVVSQLPHTSPINCCCLSESSLCLLCNNNKNLNCVLEIIHQYDSVQKRSLLIKWPELSTNDIVSFPGDPHACSKALWENVPWTEVILENITSPHLGLPIPASVACRSNQQP